MSVSKVMKVPAEARPPGAPDKGPRGLRWTKHETLTLVSAKKEELEKALGASSKGFDASDVKWVTISQYCKVQEVERDASQCRKRWHSLFKEYKKIKDLEKVKGTGFYWNMTAENRREMKIAASFDVEVYDALEKYSKQVPVVIPKDGPPKDSPGDIEDSDDMQPEAEEAPALQIAALDTVVPASSNLGMDSEQPSAHSNGRRKRKRLRHVTTEERLLSALEIAVHGLETSSSKLQEHLSLDRDLRTEQGKNLMDVLNRLVDAMGRIADAMHR